MGAQLSDNPQGLFGRIGIGITPNEVETRQSSIHGYDFVPVKVAMGSVCPVLSNRSLGPFYVLAKDPLVHHSRLPVPMEIYADGHETCNTSKAEPQQMAILVESESRSDAE